MTMRCWIVPGVEVVNGVLVVDAEGMVVWGGEKEVIS